jgi:hypothetical protein
MLSLAEGPSEEPLGLREVEIEGVGAPLVEGTAEGIVGEVVAGEGAREAVLSRMSTRISGPNANRLRSARLVGVRSSLLT